MSSDFEYDSESDTESNADPGKMRIWFGKYKGKVFDELDEGYVQWCLHPARGPGRENQYWYREILDLNDQYEAWYADTHTARSPGAIILWFGKYTGFEFSYVYNNERGYLKAIHEDKYEPYPWFYKIRDLTDQYRTWLEDHSRNYVPRRATELIRDIGDKTGPWDDNLDAPDPLEEYEPDDFLARDDEPIEQEPESAEEEEAEFTDRESSGSESRSSPPSVNFPVDLPSDDAGDSSMSVDDIERPNRRLFRKATPEEHYIESIPSQGETTVFPKVTTRRRALCVRSESPETLHEEHRVVAPESDDEMSLD